MAQPQIHDMIQMHTASLQTELASSKKTIEELKELHKNHVNVPDITVAKTTTKAASSSTLETHAEKSRSAIEHCPSWEIEIQEKDELIRVLKQTLDDVAKDSEHMEKLILTQIETIEALKKNQKNQNPSQGKRMPITYLIRRHVAKAA
jgi:hypothetical protein